jgi:hypothetical protein
MATADAPLLIAIFSKEGVRLQHNQSIVLESGDTLQLVAKIMDYHGLWLSEFESDSAPISWKLTSVNSMVPPGSLAPAIGYKTSFIASMDYSFSPCQIIATFSQDNYSISEYVEVRVYPPPEPSHLVIEPDSTMLASPNTDNRLGIVSIACYENYRSVYAIQRDPYGNFISLSGHVVWQSRDTAIAAVSPADSLVGEGIIRCKKYGSAWVVAQDSSLGDSIFDSVRAECAGPCTSISRLRIVKQDSVPIDSLPLRVGESVTLDAQAARIDSVQFDDVGVNWAFSEGLRLSSVTQEPAPPSGRTHSWTFSALDTGRGWIKIYLSSDNAIPDSIWVIVLPATGANNRCAAPGAATIRLGNRIIGVPHSAVRWTMSGFDLMGRVSVRKQGRFIENQTIQLTAQDARNSGMMLVVVTLRDEQNTVLKEVRFLSVFVR